MFKVTRKQMIRQGSNVIKFEDSAHYDSEVTAGYYRLRLLAEEIQQGGQPFGSDKVIFETSSFYRSVTVTIEEIK